MRPRTHAYFIGFLKTLLLSFAFLLTPGELLSEGGVLVWNCFCLLCLSSSWRFLLFNCSSLLASISSSLGVLESQELFRVALVIDLQGFGSCIQKLLLCFTKVHHPDVGICELKGKESLPGKNAKCKSCFFLNGRVLP